MRFLPFVLFLLLLVGCASTEDVSRVRQDVTTVYSEQSAFREKTEARLARVEKELAEISRVMKAADEGLKRQNLDLSVALDNKEERMKTLMGRVDELESQLRAYWEETKSGLRELRRAREGAGQPQGGAKPNPEGAYKLGFEAFQKGNYKESLERFGEFTKAYPDSPLLPNSFYWMGEAAMNLNDHEKAIVQFQEVIDKYPNSDKAARAMLRQAEAFRALNDKKSSATLLKRLVELFPKTEEARVAERLLRSLQ